MGYERVKKPGTDKVVQSYSWKPRPAESAPEQVIYPKRNSSHTYFKSLNKDSAKEPVSTVANESPAPQTSVQLKCSLCEAEEARQTKAMQSQVESGNPAIEAVQLAGGGNKSEKSVQQLAAEGFSGSATTLPHLKQLEESFGQPLSHVQAYIGGSAATACSQMGAQAYASGNQIAFKEQPSLELAAHETAHVVQQASGLVQLSGGVGKVGDKYEEHADAVAALVVAGQSSVPLLTPFTGAASPAVQTMSHDAVQGKYADRSADPMSPESGAIQSTEPQGWLDIADAAIKEGRFQDALRAYDEGISLNPDVASPFERGKLSILERPEKAPVQLENQEEAPVQLENQTEIIAQSNPAAFSNLPPWEERPDKENDEPQRQKAINTVRDNAKYICQTAQAYNVTPDAIAGAILWEGIENPYPAWRPDQTRPNIAGKIHPYPGDVAEKVEEEGRVPALQLDLDWPGIGSLEAASRRTERLKDPQWAIMYIGAILDRAAEIYEQEAIDNKRKPYNIRDQAGILGTLYQGGNVKKRAEGFEERRAGESDAVPKMHKNEKMGPWISQYRWWIRDLLRANGCSPQGFPPDNQIGPEPILKVPVT